MHTLDDSIRQAQKDPKFNDYYQRELLINAIAKMIVELRHSQGLTQMELAKKAQTSQSAVARLEKGDDERMPSLDLLSRIAIAFHAKLTIEFSIQDQ